MTTGTRLTGSARVRHFQTVLYAKAKEEPERRFHALCNKVWREDFLRGRPFAGDAGLKSRRCAPCVWTRRAGQDHVLGAGHEAEFVRALDLLALDSGPAGDIERGQRFDSRQARGAHGGLQAAIVA